MSIPAAEIPQIQLDNEKGTRRISNEVCKAEKCVRARKKSAFDVNSNQIHHPSTVCWIYPVAELRKSTYTFSLIHSRDFSARLSWRYQNGGIRLSNLPEDHFQTLTPKYFVFRHCQLRSLLLRISRYRFTSAKSSFWYV